MCLFGYLLKEEGPKTIKAINAKEIASKDLLNTHIIIFFLNQAKQINLFSKKRNHRSLIVNTGQLNASVTKATNQKDKFYICES